MGTALLIVAVLATVIGVASLVRGVIVLVRRFAVGRPSPGRLQPVGRRLGTTVIEVFGHTAFRARPVVSVAHWFVMMSFAVRT